MYITKPILVNYLLINNLHECMQCIQFSLHKQKVKHLFNLNSYSASEKGLKRLRIPLIVEFGR